jgi:hypothetical protein
LVSGNPFLNEVSPDHRSIVAPYLQKWDAESTKKFQENAAKYKPYEELGPVEELAKYKAFTDNFRQDPGAMFRRMFQNLQEQYPDDFEEKLLEILQIEVEEEMSSEYEGQEYEGGYEPDPNEAFQQNVMQELEELRQFKESYEQQQTTQQEEEQLATFLGAMHNAYGEFDDDWIILRLSEGLKPPEVMKAWQAHLTKYGASTNGNTPRQPPKTMSSGGQGGGVPNSQVNVSKLRGADRKAAVMALLGNEE